MSKILGLDLGTNSIGWAVVENESEKNKETFELKNKGVIIFSEGVKSEKGNEISRAAERTEFRSARRLKFRRKLRKFETLLVLSKNGMCPLNENEVIDWKKSGFKKYPINEDFLYWLQTDNQGSKDNKEERIIRKSAVKNPYYLRDKASRQKINKLELGRVFYHIAQRRGFLSNRLDQSDKGIIEIHKPNLLDILEESKTITELTLTITEYFENIEIANKKKKDLDAGGQKLYSLYYLFLKVLKEKEDLKILKNKIGERLNRKENLGKVKQGIDDLNEKIKKGDFKTLGQYFYSIYGKTNQRIRNQYTAREEHYIEEFEQICKVQDLGEINRTENEPSKRYKGLTLALYKAIFYQRPLKSQKGLVGKCTLEPTKYRCPVSRPEFEEYRMYQYLNNFKIKTPENEKLRELTEDEKEKIKPLFFRKKTHFDFEEVVKKIIPKNEIAVFYKSKDAITAKYIVNYKLNASLSNCPTIAHFRTIFGEDWKNLNYSYKTIGKKGVEKARTINYQDIWHVWTTFTTNEKLYGFAFKKLDLAPEVALKFSKVTLKKDYASVSLKAINGILPYLKEGLIYSHAVFMANMKNVVKEQIWYNKEDRDLIQLETKKIIDNHRVENKLLFVINSYIKINFKNSYSKQADFIYRKELEKSFEFEFGKKKWTSINADGLFEDNYTVFVEQFKKKEFLQIKRIDEKVIDFLNGKNQTGEVYLKDLKHSNKLYHPSDIEKFKLEKVKNKEGEVCTILGSPLSNSIKNPMAMKSLHKVRKLINTLILEEVIDENTKVHIELARELNDANKRKAMQKWQKDREDERINYRKAIKELYKEDYEPTETDLDKFKMMLEQRADGKIISKEDILKYKLWKEQNHICLYTGNTINLESFLGKNPKYDIEHTIPRSISIDDSQMNKTLCESKFNRDIKKNQIPFQLSNHSEIMSRIYHWKGKLDKLETEIKGLVKASKTATDKEAKDRIIQKRHYLKMEYNYWKGKYERFEKEEIKAGFKNSQIVDIGIITKYAQQYLKSYFKKVYSVKGTMVDQFKKSWGIKKTIKDKDGIEKKDRSNHIHHCEDAITIACMTKNKYDLLAHAWGLEEKGELKKARKELENNKPWKTFTEDVKNIYKEVLIVHSHKDKVPMQSKKKLRKRGKIQYNKNGEAIYQQGDTVRGSLHLDTFYGAILQQDAVNSKPFAKDKGGNGIIKYVVRKPLDGIKKTDIDKIVDEAVKKIIKQAIKDDILVAKKDVYKIEIGKTVWMNEEKQIPIRKVRVYTPSIKNPLKDFKKHSVKDKSKHPHKREYYVQNDENYCMAIYEGEDKKGNIKRTFELINMLEAGNYYKLSNKSNAKENEIVPIKDFKTNFPLKYLLTKNTQVLFYQNNLEEIWEIDSIEKQKRLYKIIGFEADGRIQLRFHQTAMQQSSTNADELTIVKYMKDNNLKNSEVNYTNPVPWLRLSKGNLNFIVNGVDFKITPLGKIEKL
ncbi:type II CRISPR RNA-guided endonuclease Cas9 [Lutibacter sp.]|uniref:type II CRISPR RNA-guided endonuclease Cas9 n=1 Tax=Lutibacter sp. TaxID=1925666 RepID=UPI0025C049AD|nr:type II CRISPR RNA-guided endonuclease Cas9 [Lutibacter sp.]MCF6182473.1 type II CRISPR RNA-guided endonuclease Cas9 [Lutibacter sp.]